MNAQGDVVGWALFGAAPAGVSSFFWHAGAFARLPDDPAMGTAGTTCAGAPVADARGASPTGVVYGNIDGTTRPVLWASPTAKPVELGTAPSPSGCELRTRVVRAINAQGDYTGGANPTGPSCHAGFIHAFLAPAGGGLQDLRAPDLTGCGNNDITSAQGWAINAHDDVVIIQGGPSGNCPKAAFFEKGGALTQLAFPLAGTVAQSFNDADTLVTQSGGQLGYSVAGGALQTLTPIDGLPSAAPAAVNNRGDVLGDSYNGQVNHHVYTLWPQAVPPATGPPPAAVDLQSLIPASAGVTLTAVTGMSDAGAILARVKDATGQQEWVVLEPGGQRISGTITDSQGRPLPAVTVRISGTSAEGATVNVTEVSDVDGNYAATLDPGSYTVTPLPRTGSPGDHFGHVRCDGTETPGTCAITLTAGTPATASFKLVDFVVNSTAVDPEPTRSLTDGVCDTTPDGPAQTCTLPAAIALVNHLGGGTITFSIDHRVGNTFDRGVPQIIDPGSASGPQSVGSSVGSVPPASVPVSIDGTTQPGAGKVELSGPSRDTEYGLVISGGDSKVTGMVINGFNFDLTLGPPPLIGLLPGGSHPGNDVVQGCMLGTDPLGNRINSTGFHGVSLLILEASGNTIGGAASGQGNVILGSLGELHASRNVVQGNTISNLTLTFGRLNTVGGPAPGAGNTITTASVGSETLLARGFFIGLPPKVHAPEVGDVFQGNKLGALDVSGSNMTIGGATRVPGSPPGNEIGYGGSGRTLILSGRADVVEGNTIRDGDLAGVWLRSAPDAQIGGPIGADGNLIEHNSNNGAPPVQGGGGIVIDTSTSEPEATNDTIEHNQIRGNGGGGGIVVASYRFPAGVFNNAVFTTGNTISGNEMTGNAPLGIALGTDGFRYNGLNNPAGPNNFQRYPTLLGSSEMHGIVRVDLRMNEGVLGAHRRYTVELFGQGRCTQDSITPGQGAHLLVSTKLETDIFGEVRDTIAIPVRRFGADDRAYTATATGHDGSTSEFSPCLTRGHHAATFAAAGVNIEPGPVSLTTNPAQSRDATRARRHVRTRRIAAIKLFCPPNTLRACTTTVTVRLVRTRRSPLRITQFPLKLAPGELRAATFGVTASVLKALGRPGARFMLRVTTVAHDGNRRPSTRRRIRTLTGRVPR